MNILLISLLIGSPLTEEFSSEVAPAILYLSSSPYKSFINREFGFRLNYSYYQFYPYENYNHTPSLLCDFKTKKGKIELILRFGLYPETKRTSFPFFLFGIGGLYPLKDRLYLSIDYTKPFRTEFFPQDPNFNFRYKSIDILSLGITLSKSILYVVPQLHIGRLSGIFRRDIENRDEGFSDFLWFGSIKMGLRFGRFNIEGVWTGKGWGGGIGVYHKI